MTYDERATRAELIAFVKQHECSVLITERMYKRCKLKHDLRKSTTTVMDNTPYSFAIVLTVGVGPELHVFATDDASRELAAQQAAEVLQDLGETPDVETVMDERVIVVSDEHMEHTRKTCKALLTEPDTAHIYVTKAFVEATGLSKEIERVNHSVTEMDAAFALVVQYIENGPNMFHILALDPESARLAQEVVREQAEDLGVQLQTMFEGDVPQA